MLLITGLPDAGKTTYSKRYPNAVSFDEVKGGRRRWDKVIEMVEADKDLVIEGVYSRANQRVKLVEAAEGAHNVCIWLDTPLDECVRREREGRGRSNHIVQLCAETFEPPTYDEGWDEIIVMKEDL